MGVSRQQDNRRIKQCLKLQTAKVFRLPLKMVGLYQYNSASGIIAQTVIIKRQYHGVENTLEWLNQNNAEIAAWDESGEWYRFEYDTVKGWCSVDEVMDFMKEIESL